MKKYRKNLKYYQNQNSFPQRITKKIKEEKKKYFFSWINLNSNLQKYDKCS